MRALCRSNKGLRFGSSGDMYARQLRSNYSSNASCHKIRWAMFKQKITFKSTVLFLLLKSFLHDRTVITFYHCFLCRRGRTRANISVIHVTTGSSAAPASKLCYLETKGNTVTKSLWFNHRNVLILQIETGSQRV